MRKYFKPRDSSPRRRKKFLWFPKTIGNCRRWLETAEWEEVYNLGYVDDGWDATMWLDL